MKTNSNPALPPVALRVFETLPTCCMVLSPALYILTASDDYLKLTGKSREEITGKYLFDIFPKVPEWANGAEGDIAASLEKVLATGIAHRMPVARFDVPDHSNSSNLKETHWDTVHKPVLDADGNIVYIIHETRNVSAQVIDNNILRVSVDQERNKKIYAENLSHQMEMLFHSVPAQIAIISGPDMVYSYINPQYQRELFPNREVMGMPLLAAVPEIADKPIWHTLKNVYSTGEPYINTEICVPLASENGGQLSDHYFNVVYQPLRNEHGEVNAILSFKYDVTEHVTARKMLEISAQEAGLLNARLQQAFEKLQAGNEELTAANEEMAATNEELKQAQDELALLNENLEEKVRERTNKLLESEREQQALNEELTAMNEELSATNEELSISQRSLQEIVNQLGISEQKIRSLVESAPFPIAVYTGREMCIEMVNQALIDTWNRGSDLIGRTYSEVLPELAGTGVYEALAEVYRTGVAYHARNNQVDLMIDGALKPFYFNYDFTPLFDDKGNVYGVMNTAADVTDLVTAKLQAEQSQKSLFNIIMRSPVSKGILMGPDHIVDVANDRIIELWGKPRQALMKKPIFDGLPEAKGQGIEELLKRVYTTGETIEANERPVKLLRNNRLETLYLNFVYQPYRDAYNNIIGVIVNAIDLTAQVKAREEVQQLNEELAATNEELQSANDQQTVINENLAMLNAALKISQDDLQLAVEAAGLGTWDLNPQTGKLAGNEITKSWFGFDPDEDIELSKAIAAIAEPERAAVAKSIEDAVSYASGGNYDIHYTILNPLDERPRVVRAKGKAIFDDRHRATRLSGVLFDVTEQKKDEQRKNDFIGITSHELKTPLTSLKALIQVTAIKLKNSGDPFLQDAITKSGLQVKKMEAMINSFLNVSRLESGKMVLEKSLFDLSELLGDVIGEAELTMSGSRIRFEKCGQVMLEADKDKIESVITNLINNAVKYSPKGTPISVHCEHIADKVRVSVQDQGLGINEEDQKRIFDRYYRVESMLAKHISGFGIGLYLSSEIIQLHGGLIAVKSEVGKGSTFWFELPDVASFKQ
ncbi:PAS domain-containing protein [Mucilaginibacter terrae]|uniref:histidine kinase n=1 Tax=Mucilaginibacter terrae TaxID=1955052 RepID=A0ABU3H028_9SPHI|nr:PAS domain-containing protein [Mucilaginibacter terrae]MDT3405369.1 signal transduction histidine kinase [Mucilaginibacter terrae]